MTDITALAQNIEALLFSEGGSLSFKKIQQLLECSASDVAEALTVLDTSLSRRGITLVRSSTEAALVVSSTSKDAVKKANERELGREIGEAGLEVLSILLYHKPSTRSEIDYIRGVNSSSTIRTLLSRGLVERTGNPSDMREYLYRPTLELQAYLGIKNSQELPDYGIISNELAAFEAQPKTGPFEDVEHVHEQISQPSSEQLSDDSE